VFDFNCWAVFGKNWFSLHFISFKNRVLSEIRIKYHLIRGLKPVKPKLDYPFKSNHFFNRDLNYFISANSKVMSSTLNAAKNLEHANLKSLLYANNKKKITGKSNYKFYFLVRNPTKRIESYYKIFFGLRVNRLGETHLNLEYSQVAILRNLGYDVQPKDLKYKEVLSNLTFFDIVKVLPDVSDKDSHLIPQSYLLKWHYGIFKSKLKMNRIPKMENKQDLIFISEVLQIDVSKKINESKIVMDISLPQEGYEIINSVYDEGFANFKY